MKKNRTRAILMAVSIITSTVVPEGLATSVYAASPISSELLPGSLSDPESDISPELLSGLTPGEDYVEGSVILLTGADTDDLCRFPAGVLGGNGAADLRCGKKEAGIFVEELSDVTDEVKGDDLYPGGAAGEESVLGADDSVTITLVKSDGYTTAQLLEIYKDAPGVFCAEPDYICHADEDEAMAVFEDMDENDEDELWPEATEPEAFTGEETEEESGPVINSDLRFATLTDGEDTPDLTSYQYAGGAGKGGLDVPGWNDPSNRNAEGTVVAVLDTGVDYTHPDLEPVMWDEGEEYPSLVKLGGGKYGYCPVKESMDGAIKYASDDPMDDNGHGTHCAGIIGAVWDGKGVSGVANGTRIMAVKGGDIYGAFSTSDVIKGFEYVIAARQAGVNVVAVNCSFGGPGHEIFQNIAAKKTNANGINTVFAAGNSYENIDINSYLNGDYYNSSGTIIVGCNGILGKKSPFSCYGRRSVDVFAPGEYILSSYPGGNGKKSLSHFKDDAVLMKDGITPAYDDFEGETVFFDPELPEGSKLKLSVEETASGWKTENNHLFKIGIPAFTKLEANTMKLDLKDSLGKQKPEYFFLTGIVAETDYALVKLTVPLKDGKFEECTGEIYDHWTPFALKLPADTDYDNLEISVSLFGGYEDSVVYLDDVGFTSKMIRYSFLNGTSMSTPAVTAAVAIAAGSFETGIETDEETAAFRAARVVGSVSADSALEGYCRTGGVVKVSRLLEEDYIPVIVKSENDSEALTLSGYFFGDEEGSVLLDGKPCETLSWKDRKITVSMPFVPEKTEVKAEVVTAENKYGRRFVSLTPKEWSYLDRIPMEFVGDRTDYMVNMLFATDDAVYFSVYFDNKEHVWKYFPGNDNWLELSDNVDIGYVDRVVDYAVYGDYVILSSNASFSVYDRRQEKVLTEFKCDQFPSDEDLGLVNAGKDIFVYSSYKKDDKGNAEPLDKTVVYKMTPVKIRSGEFNYTKLGELSRMYDTPRVVADNSGNMYVTDGTAVEKVVYDPKTVEITSKVLSDSLFESAPGPGAYDVAAVKDGVLFFGDMETGEEDRIENDIYLMKYDGTVAPYSKSFSGSPVNSNNVLAYRNKVYFMAVNRYNDPQYELAVADMETDEANEDKPSGGGSYNVPDVPGDNVDDIKLSIDEKTYYMSLSRSVYYTASKHVLFNSKSKGTADLKLELKGFDPNKYMVKGVKIKNSKKATHTPSGNLIVAQKKMACMIPVLKKVKGVKLTPLEKAHLKTVNAYFKQNPVYFSILQRNLSDTDLGGIEPVFNTKGTKVKKLIYKPRFGAGFVLLKKDYQIEYSDIANPKAGMTVTAGEGGNLWGSRKICGN